LSTSRFGPIDGIRGIAVLVVFLSHTAGREMFIHPSLNFAGIGHIGVYLFFCLSAYLLASKLFEEGVDINAAKRFYIKRFFRIIPLYFFVIFSVFIAQHFFGHYNESYLHIKNGTTGFLQHLALYRGDGVFWSVVVEEQFYILVPLWIFLFIRFRTWAVIAFAALGILNFLLYTSKYLEWPLNVDWIKYLTTNNRTSGNYIDIFIFTILPLYFFHYNRAFFEKNKNAIAWLANILFFTLMAISVITMSEKFLIFTRPFYDFRYISLLYTLVFSLFIISVGMGNPINKFLSFAWLRYVGIFGFSIYLLHMFVFELVNLTPLPAYAKFIVAGTGIFALSAITYYIIEKPAIKFSYKVIDKLKINK